MIFASYYETIGFIHPINFSTCTFNSIDLIKYRVLPPENKDFTVCSDYPVMCGFLLFMLVTTKIVAPKIQQISINITECNARHQSLQECQTSKPINAENGWYEFTYQRRSYKHRVEERRSHTKNYDPCLSHRHSCIPYGTSLKMFKLLSFLPLSWSQIRWVLIILPKGRCNCSPVDWLNGMLFYIIQCTTYFINLVPMFGLYFDIMAWIRACKVWLM